MAWRGAAARRDQDRLDRDRRDAGLARLSHVLADLIAKATEPAFKS